MRELFWAGVYRNERQNPYIMRSRFCSHFWLGCGFLRKSARYVMAKHCRFVLLLLSFVTLVSTKFSVTRKDDADYFTWEGNEIECDRLTNSTAFGRTPSLCTCLNGRTFSTESRTCESFQDHGTYNVIEHIALGIDSLD